MMDETKETEQDSPQQDAGQSSDSDSGTTSTEPEVYTKEQVDKIRSDTLAAAGREKAEVQKALDKAQKAADESKRQAADIEARLEELQRERDEVELEAAKSSPDKFDLLKAKQAQRQRDLEYQKKERELQRRESDIKEYETSVNETRKQLDALVIAQQYNVDVAALLQFGTDKASMEALAKQLPPKEGSAAPTRRPDSGVSSGSRGGKLTTAQAKELTMDEYAKAVKEGRI